MKFFPFLLIILLAAISCSPKLLSPQPGNQPAQASPVRPHNSYFYYTEAQVAIKQGKIESAIQLLKKASRLDSNSVYLHMELASLYLSQKKKELARETLEKGLLIDPNHVDALIFYGNISHNLKQNKSALQAYQKVIQLAPQKEERVYLLLGNLWMEAGNLDAALKVYQELVANFPASFAGHYFIGKSLAEQGQTKKAETSLLRALELEPDLEEARFQLLKIYRNSGDLDRVVILYEELLQKNPKNIRAALELGLFQHENKLSDLGAALFIDLGQRSHQDQEIIRKLVQNYIDPKLYDDAIIALEGMLMGAPESSDLHYLAGITFEGQNDTKNAIKHLQQVGPNNRFYENAVVRIAAIYQDQQKMELAIQILNLAIEKAPDIPEFRLYLGSFYEELEAYADAESVLKSGLEIDPDHIQIHFRLGVVYDKWGKKSDSITRMQKVIALDPKNANALNYLGYTYADLGQNLDEAEALIREALKYKPDDGYITDSLGWVFFKKGQYEKALVYLRKAVELAPDDPIILEHLGDAYLKLNDKENALKYYQESLKKKTDDTQGIEKKINDLTAP
jgi:tetratricopeptide (TPR) repeat protein